MSMDIKWENYAQFSYTSGSFIAFEGSQVLFDNPLMPPSIPLAAWTSRTNFQARHASPSLPLLKRGRTYRLVLDAKISPQNSLYLKVSYWNRLDELLSFDVLRDDSWEFTYPIEAFSYSIELINAGCDYFAFNSLLLSDATADEEDLLSLKKELTLRFSKPNRQVNVLFLEPEDLGGAGLPLTLFKALGNLVLVGDRGQADTLYMARDFEDLLLRFLWDRYDEGRTKVHFIGYGPVGNLACLYYSSKMTSKAYVNGLLNSKEIYKKALYNSKVLSKISLNDILERLTYSNNVHRYGYDFKDGDFDLIQPALNRMAQLELLPLFSNL